ncbi:hypothetical protein PWY87_08960 [Kribbella solani]|nr:hypothetical protein [Kribbella solani]MDX2972088.1 hypothetical protein [Kribbella solani]MDX3001794.1 hypothetical protein [Kribbella solani]
MGEDQGRRGSADVEQVLGHQCIANPEHPRRTRRLIELLGGLPVVAQQAHGRGEVGAGARPSGARRGRDQLGSAGEELDVQLVGVRDGGQVELEAR